MKEYRTNEELIEYLATKGVTISDKGDAIQNVALMSVLYKNWVDKQLHK